MYSYLAPMATGGHVTLSAMTNFFDMIQKCICQEDTRKENIDDLQDFQLLRP